MRHFVAIPHDGLGRPVLYRSLSWTRRPAVGHRWVALDSEQIYLVFSLTQFRRGSLALSRGITFGVIISLTLVFNGFVVGYAITNSNRDLASSLLAVVPHGAVEIPAFVIAGAAGFWVPHGMVRYFTADRLDLVTMSDLRVSVGLFVLSCLLLLVAAWLEAVVTPIVAPV